MADSRGDAIEELGYLKEQIHLHFIKILRYKWNKRDTQTHIIEMGAAWIIPFSRRKLKNNKRLKLRDYQSVLRINRKEYDGYIEKYFTKDYLEYTPRFKNEDDAFNLVHNTIEEIMQDMTSQIRSNDDYFNKRMKEI